MKKFFSMGDWGGGGSVAALLIRHAGYEQVNQPENADLIVFNGGEDISAAIYGETPVPGYGINIKPSQRDLQEMALFEMFKDDTSKMYLGICRGAQMLNCLNGGTLFQHVDQHGRNHDMCVLATKEIIRITSTHHQQMRLGEGGIVLATASESNIRMAEGVLERPKPDREAMLMGQGDDMEIIWYPKHRTLCIQGHPEYVPGSQFANFSIDLIHTYLTEATRAAA